jgi:D-3-phosphoglycerate dehydrogenase
MKVLFIDTTHPILNEKLEELGFQCDYFADYNYEDYLNCIGNYEGVVIRSKIKLDKQIIDKGTKLRFIARVGAGLENIDVAYAESKGIHCINSPEGNRDAVAEHALGMILSLRNHLKRVDAEVRKGIWIREENRGFEMKGKTLGIIGYGNMGAAFAQRLQGFDMRVMAYDKYKKDFGNKLVEEVDLEEIFKESDILSFHVPLTAETKYMFDKEWIAKMKKPFYLINTARGPVVNTQDLLDGIEEGKILGAALDVLEFEGVSFEKLKEDELPESYKQLMQCDKVLLSPHIAGWTIESNIKLSSIIVDKVKALSLL